MKSILFITIANAALFVLSGCGKPSAHQLIGEWVSPQAGIRMEVGSGGRLRISTQERTITCGYTVDWKQTPPHIDMVPDLKTDKPVAGVIQFDGRDALRLFVSGLTVPASRKVKRQFDPKLTLLFIRKPPGPGDKNTRPDLRPPPIATIEQSQKKATAATVLHELQMLDGAVDQWAIDHNKKKGDIPTPQDVLPYFKTGTPIHTAFSAGRPVDSLGNPLGVPPVGAPPTVSGATVEKLSSAVPHDFWRPYKISR